MKRLLVVMVLVVAALACERPEPGVQMTNRGELRLGVPDGGMPGFEVAHAFGEVKTGETAALTLQAVNTGLDTLDITGVKLETASGDSGAFFVVGGTGSVAVGVTRTFRVTFAPVREGAYAGTLVFETNAVSGRARLSLNGTGRP
ncbi:MAG: hypothetical protein INH41_22375 [Myxococcaceae bacterium]|jgi:hypothetical protein|nr:hypothetical protein [Myxococcaceae bacterium]